MNKYEDAIEYLAEHSAYENVTRDGESWKEVTQKGVDALDLLTELVDKSIPMKPKLVEKGNVCSNCEVMVVVFNGYRLSYCPNCGQKLDWE